MDVRPASAADLAVPAAAGDVPAPAYGARTLADVGPGVLATLLARADTPDAPAHGPVALPAGVRRVLLLVVDGLGSRQLDRAPGVAPLLSSLPGGDGQATFPSTTVAGIASLGTGLPPSRHGLVSYCFPLPGHEHPLGGLGWRVGLRGGGFDARATVVPEALQPAPTVFERAAAAGVATTVVVDPDFPDSGLTRAVLRGGQRRTARGLATTLEVALDGLAAGDGPALAYAHHPLVDWAGHTDGACSPAWCDAVADVDATLRSLRDRLPRDTAIVVTADHGMVTVPDEDVVELADHPALTEGVRVLAGEPRVRLLALEPDADPAMVVARWRTTLGDRALVVPAAEALRWYGPAATDVARTHVGDVVVVARTGSLVHARVDPHGGRHRGQHGGPTPAETVVPLRVLTRRA